MKHQLGGLKTLAERGPRDCCWPVGEPDPKAGQLFCSQPTDGRKSYCTDHSPASRMPLKPIRLGGATRSRINRTVERVEGESDLMELLA